MVKSFVLKDSPRELLEATQGVEPQGRTYDKEYSARPGGVRIQDVAVGMKYAAIAITDDEPDTLKKVGRTMPWHIEALTVIAGSEEEAHKPLSHILSAHFNLQLDKNIDISGLRGRHFLDTQGYIAHNDEVIVLAYRCTTSFFDWITNFQTATAEWEPDVDVPQGHSGHWSCLAGRGLCCQQEYKPRVHTGFYNNFLASAPEIQEYIHPLLAPDQPSRKLYVVGHSLGAGIATLAACYFLLEYDWANLPHKLVVVTAGSPRAVKGPMKKLIQEKMKVLRPLDKAVICRVVRDKDVVATLPPAFLGFAHLDKLVYVTKRGDVLINPALDDDHIVTEREREKLNLSVEETRKSQDGADANADADAKEEAPEAEKTEYEKSVSRIPRSLRDHMPDFYLKPLIALFEKEHPEPAAESSADSFSSGALPAAQKQRW